MEDASPALLAALAFAVEAHGAVRQPRKGTSFPYVVHPIRVAEILYQFGCDEEVVIAGILHDTTEDAGIGTAEVEQRFGARVARIVAGASEPDKTASWEERKRHTINYLGTDASDDTLFVAAADKLDNVRSLRETFRQRGERGTWEAFRKGRELQHWYYRGVAEVLLARDPNNRLFRTLDFETRQLFPDQARHTRLLSGKPIASADDARAFLSDPIKHWKPRYSAFELAHAWVNADGLPAEVQAVLHDVYGTCELVEGLFEKETDLLTPGRASQTDLLALVHSEDRYVLLAVEGKAREPFGERVEDWLNGSSGKERRLGDLCNRLSLDAGETGHLRYQLLHRTVAALLEAERYRATEAVMLVQSFDETNAHLGDYQAFAYALGLTGAIPGQLTSPTTLSGTTLRLGWAHGVPSG